MKDFRSYIPGVSDPAEFGVFERSVHKTEKGEYVFTARTGKGDRIVAERSAGFKGEGFTGADGKEYVLAENCHENGELLRKLFPFTAPSPILSKQRTVGTGDRLGIATPGHLRAFSRFDVYPVLAQQSVRELNLTERDFENVLDCASRAVFREDYTRGWGADGDHLKTPEEVEYAISCGYTMITLDCSAYIKNVSAMTDQQLEAEYIPNEMLENEYLTGPVKVSDALTVEMDMKTLMQAVIIYGKAIDFAAKIWREHIKGRPVDFEISIDETDTPTVPAHHYFVANELTKRGVKITTMAPRFCGEFQKGIDYVGDLDHFRAEMKQHAAIADAFGYKISVHSGSDKFSVFPSVGELTGQHFHLKTAGTSWLEAMKLVAMKDPALYRQIHGFALENFTKATAYYHVTTDLSKIPALETLSDAELPALFENNDARQLIHITYGLILTERNDDGSLRFKDRLYDLWNTYEEDYAALLDAHIGRHLEMLCGRR